MAASLLNTCYLCSDFSRRNLIGVSEDLEEHVLVTCRGVVKQYNVRLQKQIQSWTTKSWHPFTSAAVCDPVSNNVVAVINNSIISQWNHTEDDIDKLKRENFETPIYQLLVTGGTVYVIFTSGRVEDLLTALRTRKEPKPGCVKESESITYAAINKEDDLVVLLVKNEDNILKLMRLHLSNFSLSPLSCNLMMKDAYLTGICLVSTRLFTLWSNGNMHSHNLLSSPIEKLPGRYYSTVSSVSASKKTKIVPVAPSHIAIVGADTKDEGGVLVLWDVKFAMVTSSRRLKMYHDSPMSWVSSLGIIVVDGGYLTCTPYNIAESTLATVFGSRVSNDNESEPEMCYGWDTSVDMEKSEVLMNTIFVNKSERLVEILRSLNKLSLSESLLVSNVISPLIEKKELLLLYEVMDVFEDVPESCLVSVLQFYLQCDETEFDGLMKYPPMQMECKVYKEKEVVKCPFGPGKAHFINAVLGKPHTDVQLTKELNKLSFEDSLSIIQYLYFLILAGEVLLCPGEEGVKRDLSLAEVSEWLSLILDTKYHQLVMTSQVPIHRLLLSCFTQLTDMRKLLQELINLEPMIKRIVEEDNTHQQENMSCSGYSLERLVITR